MTVISDVYFDVAVILSKVEITFMLKMNFVLLLYLKNCSFQPPLYENEQNEREKCYNEDYYIRASI